MKNNRTEKRKENKTKQKSERLIPSRRAYESVDFSAFSGSSFP